MKVSLKKSEIIGLLIGINGAVNFDKNNEFTAKFKYAMLKNEKNLETERSTLQKVVTDKLSDFVKDYEEGLYEKYKQIGKKEKELIGGNIVHYGLYLLKIPEFKGDEKLKEKFFVEYESLTKKYETIFDDLDKLFKEEIEVDIFKVNLEEIHDKVPYDSMKKLDIMIEDK